MPEELCLRLKGLLGSSQEDEVLAIASEKETDCPRRSTMEQSEDRDFTDGLSEIVQEASPLVSCFWCERLHPGEHPLSVCPACAAGY